MRAKGVQRSHAANKIFDMIFLTVAVALIGSLNAPLSYSQMLTWEACLEETAPNNPDIVVAQQEIDKARAKRNAGLSPFLPQLSASAGYNRSESLSSLSNEYNMSLSARQSLFSGWRDKVAWDKSALDLEIAQARFQGTGAQVSFELKSAFVRLLFAQENLKLAQTIAKRRQDNVRLVELRYQAGREHKGSYLRSRAAWRQSEFEMSQTQRALRVAQRELSRVLGREETEPLEVSGELAVENAPQETADFKALAKFTPAYAQARHLAEAAAMGVVSARGAFMPELSASGSLGRGGNDWPPDSPTRWSTGLSLTFPFFTGGKNIFDTKSALAEERRAQASFKSVALQTALDLEDAFAGYQDAWEKTGVQEEFLLAARTRSEIARSQYASGLLSFQDWDLIENDLISNQKAWLAARRDAVIAQASWQKAQGRGYLP